MRHPPPTYSGGKTISTGTIGVRNSSALGSGSVSAAAGGVLLIGTNGISVANDIEFNEISGGGAINSFAPSAGNVTNLTGKITLNTTSNMTTHWKDKTLQLSGKITGAGGLNFDLRTGGVGGRYLISGSTNDYAGATSVTGTATTAFQATGQAMLYLGATNVLPTTTALTLNYADLYLNGQLRHRHPHRFAVTGHPKICPSQGGHHALTNAGLFHNPPEASPKW